MHQAIGFGVLTYGIINAIVIIGMAIEDSYHYHRNTMLMRILASSAIALPIALGVYLIN